MMLRTILTSAAVIGLMTGPAFADGPTLTLTNFIGTIDMAAGSEISVKGEADDTVSTSGDNVTIDGGETIKQVNCKSHYGSFSISVNNKSWIGKSGGYKDLEEYPSLKIKAPKDVRLVINNSVLFGTAGDIGSADIKLSSCGELTVGNIEDTLDLKVSGSADFKAKDVGAVIIKVSGSGDAELQDTSSAEVSVTGSGDIEMGDIDGPLVLTTRGSGDVAVGHIRGDLVYEGSGSSDLEVNEVSKRVAIEVRGSGDVSIDDGDIDDLFVTASGSSHVEFDGNAKTADLSAAGSSHISVGDVSGEVKVDRSGSADIQVGDKNYN